MSTQARARTRTAWGWSCPRALARVYVEIGGPGIRVAAVTGEVADRVAELLSAPQQKLMTSTLPDWRVEGATPARQASKRRWGTGRGRRRCRTRAHLRSPPGHRPARSTVEVHDESCEVRWPRARRLAKGLCAIERRSVSDDQGCGSGVMPGLPSPVEASGAVCAEDDAGWTAGARVALGGSDATPYPGQHSRGSARPAHSHPFRLNMA
jgi:hypothetical protein